MYLLYIGIYKNSFINFSLIIIFNNNNFPTINKSNIFLKNVNYFILA